MSDKLSYSWTDFISDIFAALFITTLVYVLFEIIRHGVISTRFNLFILLVMTMGFGTAMIFLKPMGYKRGLLAALAGIAVGAIISAVTPATIILRLILGLVVVLVVVVLIIIVTKFVND